MAFARAMLSSPPVLLLDEPTRSLDPLAAARMRALISSLAEGDPPVTILLTSHNLVEVEELCGRIAIISRGRIRAIGKPDNLRTDHHQSERLRVIVGGITLDAAKSTLSRLSGDLEIVQEGAFITIGFTRESGDGGNVLSIDTQRATLMEVLERYETEQSTEYET